MSLRKPSRKKQDEKIAEEIAKWNELFSEISEDKKEAAQRLIEQAAFMKVTLDILKVNIQLDGATYWFEQGKQKMLVENPAQKSYNTMINRYTTVCNSLFNLLPKGNDTNDDDDDLEVLLNRRNTK